MNKENFEALRDKIGNLRSLPVINGYYLVLGGGKIGTDFVQYAKKQGHPFVLVIDMDEHAPASRDAAVIDRTTLFEILRDQEQFFRDVHSESGVAMDATLQKGIYFHCMDVADIASILNFGIPEYLVPAIPSHALVNMVVDILKTDNGSKLVDVLQIADNDRERLTLFEDIQSYFPEDLVVFKSHEHAVIFLSYAKEGEICPAECTGPSDYCYNFKREKPDTITGYARKIPSEYMGWVFESCQVKPGIGGIYGPDLKNYLIEIMEHVRKTDIEEPSSLKRVFFIVTSCNCHGILNLLYSL